MKIHKNFYLQEFIPNEIFKVLGSYSKYLIHPEIFNIVFFIREYYGYPIIINNWHIGGKGNYRGFRPFDCKIGAKKSMHKIGKAVDLIIKDFSTTAEIRNKIIDSPDLFLTLKRIELGVPHLHLDLKPTSERGITLFSKFKINDHKKLSCEI